MTHAIFHISKQQSCVLMHGRHSSSWMVGFKMPKIKTPHHHLAPVAPPTMSVCCGQFHCIWAAVCSAPQRRLERYFPPHLVLLFLPEEMTYIIWDGGSKKAISLWSHGAGSLGGTQLLMVRIVITVFLCRLCGLLSELLFACFMAMFTESGVGGGGL